MGLWGPRFGLCELKAPLGHWKTALGLKVLTLSLLALGFRQVRNPCGLLVRRTGAIAASPRC